MGASALQQKYQKSILQRGCKISKKVVPDLFQLGEGATDPSCPLNLPLPTDNTSLLHAT